MTHTQDDILLTLSYLRGERTVPTSNVEGRKEFIQQTLHEVHAAYPWKFAEVNTTLTVVAGIATLPSGTTLEHEISVSDVSGDIETEWTNLDVADRRLTAVGDKAFWITPLTDDMFQINTKATVDTILVKYQGVEPTINASITTQYPDRLTLALGANRFVKLSEDPDADLSQDDTLFQNRLNKNIAAQNMAGARPMLKTAQSQSGSYTGEF
jgi:hypothetical protein